MGLVPPFNGPSRAPAPPRRRPLAAGPGTGGNPALPVHDLRAHHPLLEVLVELEGLQGAEGLLVKPAGEGPPVVARRQEELLDLPHHGTLQAHLPARVGRPEVEPVEAHQPVQLLDGPRVVVDPQVQPAVVVTAVATLGFDHQQGGRLLPAPVATRRLGRAQRLDQALLHGQAAVAGRLVGPGHLVHHGGTSQDVALAGIPLAHPVPGPLEAGLARVGCRPPLGVDHPQLAVIPLGVGLHQAGHHLFRREALAQQRQAVGAVAHVGPGLGGDGAGARFGPGHHRPDGEELGLDSDPPDAGCRVRRHDGEGCDPRRTARCPRPAATARLHLHSHPPVARSYIAAGSISLRVPGADAGRGPGGTPPTEHVFAFPPFAGVPVVPCWPGRQVLLHLRGEPGGFSRPARPGCDLRRNGVIYEVSESMNDAVLIFRPCDLLPLPLKATLRL